MTKSLNREIKEINFEGYVTFETHDHVHLCDEPFCKHAWEDQLELAYQIFNYFDELQYPSINIDKDDWRRGDFRLVSDVFVSYYIANQPMSWEEAKESHIRYLAGDLKQQKMAEGYSEMTIGDEWTTLFVGGHNLIREIETYERKYLLLKIKFKVLTNQTTLGNKTK